jgi:hypothetical protein
MAANNENKNSERKCHPCVPYLLMVFVQLGLAGLTVLGDLALNDGMTPYTFVVYRHLIATLLITPFALYRERYAYNTILLLCPCSFILLRIQAYSYGTTVKAYWCLPLH